MLGLPLAVSCAGQDDGRRHASTGPDDLRPVSGPGPEGRNPEKRASGERAAERRDSGDGAAPVRTPEPDQAPPGTHLSTALRCGPALSSPDGVEAQTCVAVRGEDVWARTYYRNTTGAPLDAALSLLGPDGHSVRSRCVAGAGDDPSLCETPRVRLKGEGPLLLRAGSNSPAGKDR